jgi:hypothetical protein
MLELAAHPAPAPRESRTPERIAIAACSSPNGQWYCRTPKPRAFGPKPIIFESWTVPAWFIDPANISGTASDSNDCTTPLTACRTYQEIAVHRWATYSPRLRQATTLTWLSNDLSTTDPVYFNPYVENGAAVTMVGTLTQVASGSLANLVPKNRLSSQLLNVTLAADMMQPTLVKNTTRSTGAWLYKLVSGTTWALSQPLPTPTSNGNITPNEDDSWSGGDAYAAYTLPTINLREVVNHQTNFTNGTILIKNLVLGAPNSLDPIHIEGVINIAECSIQTLLRDEGTIISGPESGLLNDDFAAGFTLLHGSPGGGPGLMYLVGGQYRASTPMFWNGSVQAAGDVIIGSPLLVWGAGALGYAGGLYIEAGTTINVLGNVLSVANANYGNYIWGPGTLDIRTNGRFGYPAGAGQAAATFLGVTLLLNNQTKGCAGNPVAGTSTCNVTVKATNLDSNGGATPICLYVPGSASFCNFF